MKRTTNQPTNQLSQNPMMSPNTSPKAADFSGCSSPSKSGSCSATKRVQVSLPVMNGLMASHRRFAESVIEAIADHYNFSSSEAIHLFLRDVVGEEPVRNPRGMKTSKTSKVSKAKRETPLIPLPWTGSAVDGWCMGLRLNQGLHSQCSMEPTSGGIYCKTCQKQADANSSGAPTYGNCEMRMKVGVLEYRDPKDQKQSVPYSTVMAKLNISRETAEEEASKFGLTIPEEQFAERKVSRGRPRKDPSASDTESSGSEDTKAKRGRGRPKKEKKVVETTDGDDLIAQLVSAAKTDAAKTDTVTHTNSLSIIVNEEDAAFLEVGKMSASHLQDSQSPTPVAPRPAATSVAPTHSAVSSPSPAATPAAPTPAATPAVNPNVTLRKPKMDKAAMEAKKAAKKAEEAARKAEKELARIAKAKLDAYEAAKRDIDANCEEDAEEVDYEEKEVNGVVYAFADDFLYSLADGKCVGFYNPKTQEIEEIEESDDEE